MDIRSGSNIPISDESNKPNTLCSTQPTSIEDVPFSVLSELFLELRKARPSSGKSAPSSSGIKATETRRTILTRAWLQISEYCGRGTDVLSKRNSNGHFIPSQIFPPEDSFKLVALIIPSLDSSHSYLGMKETKLADAFIRALDLVPNGEDAQWLKHYKENAYRPQKWKRDAEIVDGNIATVIKAVLKDRCPTKSSLTIDGVWTALNTLSQASSGGPRRIGKVQTRILDSSDKSSNTSMFPSREHSFPEQKRALALRSLITNGTALEVSEVSRIILKDIDIRLSEDSFFNWFHPGAKQHYTQVHDIHKLLKNCYDPNFEVGEASVQVGQYASVMLTMRPSRKRLNSICEKLCGKGKGKLTLSNNEKDEVSINEDKPYFIMEPKLDGERLQLHKWKTTTQNDTPGGFEIRTFSRRGNDSSPMYAGALTDVVMENVKAESIILDGEIMIWDDLKASWLRFEDVREVSTSIAKKNVVEGASYTLKYMIFDILYVDQGATRHGNVRKSGNMVIRLPLHQRRELLSKLITPGEASYGAGATAKIDLVQMERGYDEKQLTDTLQRYETLGYEGVIAKNPDMPYALAERSLDISIKLKPDYFDGGIQDLDVLILGAKYSASKGHRVQRAGRLSSFLVGVRANDSAPKWRLNDFEWEEKMKKCKWIPVGSIGTGYSDKDLERLQDLFSGQWKDFDPRDLPSHFERRDYTPTVLMDVAKWIDPWKSVVVSIRAYEVNRRYFVLRFPRVQRINWEKPYYDVPTFTHLLDLDENKVPVIIRSDEADADDVLDAPGKKRRITDFEVGEQEALKRVKDEGHKVTGGRSSRAIISSAKGADVSKVVRLSTIFKGTKFIVMGSVPEAKERLEVKIHELGGNFVQNFTTDIDFVICTTAANVKVRNLKERFSQTKGDQGTCSIIKCGWIDKCHAGRKRVSPTLDQIIYVTKKLEEELYETVDRFGVPWEGKFSVESLETCLEVVEMWKRENSSEWITKSDHNIEKKLLEALRRSGNIFQTISVYIPHTPIPLPGSCVLLQAYGATQVNEESSADYVLVHSSLKSSWHDRVETLRNKLVTENWVRSCVDERDLVDPCNF